MRLHFNPASPFVRKVLIVAHELGLADRIELMPEMVVPVKPNAAVAADNPLIKIPTLVLENGTSLFDSRVVAEYLDDLGGGDFFPPAGPARWQALRLQAAADGLMDAAVLTRYERAVRPVERQWDDWAAGQLLKMRQALDFLETAASGFAVPGTIAEVATVSALGYLDFRYPDEGWCATRPALAVFYTRFAERPSFIATRPPAG